MRRVAAVLDEWARRLGLTGADRTRWSAAGWLHDVLRDADPESIRHEVEEPFRELPGSFLHGPATVARLQREGVEDAPLLEAIRFHTLGAPGLGPLGHALIAADYLEPGRTDRPIWRAALRARMPEQFGEVMRAVVGDKLRRGLEREEPLRPEMIELWNELAADANAN